MKYLLCGGDGCIYYDIIDAIWKNTNDFPIPSSELIERVYRGEGTLSLTAYQPYARSRTKTIEGLGRLDEDVYLNCYHQWQDASGILKKLNNYDGTTSPIKIYNPGDMETDFTLEFDINELVD
jgi:hypothetical protein